jgi:hypothetical protein
VLTQIAKVENERLFLYGTCEVLENSSP